LPTSNLTMWCSNPVPALECWLSGPDMPASTSTRSTRPPGNPAPHVPRCDGDRP
jgi:hypothetical protein